MRLAGDPGERGGDEFEGEAAAAELLGDFGVPEG
jgi:hypothetical protein